MFEKKLKDSLPPSLVSAPAGLCEEERELQHTKIDELKYISYLLEKLCWHAAPGAMEFSLYQTRTRKEYEDACNISSPTKVYGNLRA